MGTKRAKGGHLAPGAIQCAKKCAPQVALVFTISVFSLSSTPGRTTDLLKWGLPGGGVKSAKVAPTPYVYSTPVVATTVTHTHTHSQNKIKKS